MPPPYCPDYPNRAQNRTNNGITVSRPENPLLKRAAMSCVTLPCKGIFINGCRILSYSRHCAWRLTPAVLHSKVLATGKIENIIPQFPPTCPAATAVIIRQTMPETEMIEIRTARLQIEDAIGDFVKNTQHTTCGRAGLGGGIEQIKFARKQILIIRERVSFLHGCTFFVSF